ncbi:MAG: FAM151 family protein [Flavobacteriaceae bacterium]|nr:FAM151 family protein [Flavobacteriaceae bacterium]
MTLGSFTKGVIILILLFIAVFFYKKATFKIDHIGYSSKLWAHRVNSIEKLEHTQKNYVGIELDIVFNSTTKTFDVNHPPAKSIHLNLEEYLSHINQTNELGIWLDFKNLDSENVKTARNRLLFLTEKYQLNKNNIIVESQYPEYLKLYQEAGFKTSYYLPAFLYRLSPEELSKKIEEIKIEIKSQTPSSISTNIVDYEIIASNFPEQTKYLWSIDKTFTTRMFKNFIQTRKALKDPKVEVLLVRVNRKKGHR